MEASLGQTLWETATGISLEAWAEYRRNLDAREVFRDFECAVRTVAGEEIWISCSGEPTIDEQGHFVGYHGTARDQTLRRRTEAILCNQKELLNEMVEHRTKELRAALEQAKK